MVNESATFVGATVVLVVGLVVMLYGVSLNAGQALNTPMLVGGVVVLVGVGIHTAGVMALDEPEHGAEH